jgi:uncharacterized protein (DUF4415 family)
MKDRTEWARVKAMTDDEIDYSDCPPLDKEFWATAQLVMPEPKVSIGVRFDRSVVNWFKKQGKGYQTKMNAVLRTYVESQQNAIKQKPRKKAG